MVRVLRTFTRTLIYMRVQAESCNECMLFVRLCVRADLLYVKIWAMAVRGGDNAELVTGGADSTLKLWADRTREQKQAQAAGAEQVCICIK